MAKANQCPGEEGRGALRVGALCFVPRISPGEQASRRFTICQKRGAAYLATLSHFD